MAGKTFPAFPAHAQTAILRIWEEAHGENTASFVCGIIIDGHLGHTRPRNFEINGENLLSFSVKFTVLLRICGKCIVFVAIRFSGI